MFGVARSTSMLLALLLAILPVAAETASRSASADTASELEQAADSADLDSQGQLRELDKQLSDLFNQNNFDEALKVAQQAVELSESMTPADSDLVAGALINLASVLQAKGALGDARPLLEKALRLTETAHGAQHPSVALCLTKLGMLIKTQADYDSAEPLYKRALSIQEVSCGKDSMEVAAVLRNLANLSDARSKYNDGLTLNQRVEKVYRSHMEAASGGEPDEEKLKQTSLLLAENLNDQAAELIALDKTEQAQPLLEQSIKIRKKLLPEGDVETAESINNLAMLFLAKKDVDRAMPFLKVSLEESQKVLGPEHLTVADCLSNLGEAALQKGDLASAQDYYLKSAQLVDRHIRQVLPNLSFAEQRQFLDDRVPGTLSLLLRCCRAGEPLTRAYDLLFRWKGLLIESFRRATLTRELSGDPALKEKTERLQELRRQISSWYLQSGAVSFQEWKSKNDVLTADKEALERELCKNVGRGQLQDSLYSRSLSDVWQQMKGDEVLMDVYVYHYAGKDMSAGWRYAAVLSGPKLQPVLVDLGGADTIVSKISKWQNEVLAGKPALELWEELAATAFKPALDKLPKGISRVWVCPDGELYRVPWHLMAESDERCLSMTICQADSVRELSNLWAAEKIADASPNIFLAGGVDFNNTTASSSPAAPTAKHHGLELPPLPATLKEIKEIEQIAVSCNIKYDELIGKSATKDAVIGQLPKSEYVHLATHGLFLPENLMHEVRSQLESADPAARAVKILPQYLRQRGPQRNVLVESALAFAGANNLTPGAGLSGFLTAEELLGTNLSQCRLLALSACETARGKEITGQGVMGLRASIMGAGARSVLMSLWKVPDDATMLLMKYFYTNLWQKKMSKVDALIAAQKELRKKLDHLPYAWAAWIIVGD